MPIYTYQDKNTGTIVEIIRKIKDIDKLPTQEECPAEFDISGEEWEKVIMPTSKFTRAPGWGHGSKGNW